MGAADEAAGGTDLRVTGPRVRILSSPCSWTRAPEARFPRRTCLAELTTCPDGTERSHQIPTSPARHGAQPRQDHA